MHVKQSEVGDVKAWFGNMTLVSFSPPYPVRWSNVAYVDYVIQHFNKPQGVTWHTCAIIKQARRNKYGEMVLSIIIRI